MTKWNFRFWFSGHLGKKMNYSWHPIWLGMGLYWCQLLYVLFWNPTIADYYLARHFFAQCLYRKKFHCIFAFLDPNIRGVKTPLCNIVGTMTDGLFSSSRGIIPTSNTSMLEMICLQCVIPHYYWVLYPELEREDGRLAIFSLCLPWCHIWCPGNTRVWIQGYELICPARIYSTPAGSCDFTLPKMMYRLQFCTTKVRKCEKILMVWTLLYPRSS